MQLQSIGQTTRFSNLNEFKYDSSGQYLLAIDSLNVAISLEANNAELWYRRGICRMFLQQYSLALVDLNKTIFLDTGIVEAYYYRSLANEKTNNFQFALADINFYISRRPEDLVALYNRAQLCEKMGESKQAMADFKTLAFNCPDSIYYHLSLLNIYYSEGSHKEGLELSTQLIQKFPQNWNLYFIRAYLNYWNAEYNASLNDANIYLLENPSNFEMKALKADNYFFLERFEEAAEMYQVLLSIKEGDADLLADYGHCLLQLKKYAKADEILSKSIKASTISPAYAYLGRGIARFNMGRRVEACEDWVKSEKLGEGEAKKYINLNCKN